MKTTLCVIAVLLGITALSARCFAQGSRPAAESARFRAAVPATGPASLRGRTSMSADAGLFALGGASALGSGVALFLSPSPFHATEPGWRGGILFDDGARSALRLGTPDALDIAATVSDVLLVATMLGAVAIESTLAPLVQGDPDLALQAHSAHMLALGITLGLVEIVKHAVGRARPYTTGCENDPSRPECGNGGDANASFYSGHTSMAFTSAGFSCAMHLSRHLYGDVGADVAACASSVALAAGTGLLRVAADRHYLTDVLLGAVTGFAVGYLVTLGVVPEIGSGPSEDDGSDFSAVFVPMVSPSVTSGGTLGASAGISVVGSF